MAKQLSFPKVIHKDEKSDIEGKVKEIFSKYYKKALSEIKKLSTANAHCDQGEPTAAQPGQRGPVKGTPTYEKWLQSYRQSHPESASGQGIPMGVGAKVDIKPEHILPKYNPTGWKDVHDQAHDFLRSRISSERALTDYMKAYNEWQKQRGGE